MTNFKFYMHTVGYGELISFILNVLSPIRWDSYFSILRFRPKMTDVLLYNKLICTSSTCCFSLTWLCGEAEASPDRTNKGGFLLHKHFSHRHHGVAECFRKFANQRVKLASSEENAMEPNGVSVFFFVILLSLGYQICCFSILEMRHTRSCQCRKDIDTIVTISAIFNIWSMIALILWIGYLS